MRNLPILLLSAILAPIWVIHSQPRDSLNISSYLPILKSQMIPIIQQQMKKYKVTGLCIAVVDNQDIIWSEGFGYADKGKKIKATPDKLFEIGSISKLFTATAIMQLQKEGKIDIDKPVTTYYPEFDLKSRFHDALPITVRHLLTHHSGLPHDYVDSINAIMPAVSLEDQLAAVTASSPPGHHFSYSNIGMLVLGKVVERVSGTSFNDYVKAHILLPLKMINSSFDENDVPDSAISNSYAHGHINPTRKWGGVSPAGSLFSSAIEMSNFIRMVNRNGSFEDKQILDSATLASMLSVQNKGNLLDYDTKNGLGWFLSYPYLALNYSKFTIACHGGYTAQFCSMLAIACEPKVGVIVLSNSSDPTQECEKIAEEMLKHLLKIKHSISCDSLVLPPVKSMAFSQKQLLELPGHYCAPLVGLAEIFRKGDRLFVAAKGLNVELSMHADSSIALHKRLLGFPIRIMKQIRIFIHSVEGCFYVAVKSDDPNWPTTFTAGYKLQPVPIPDSWRKRLGKYSYVLGEQKVTEQLHIEKGFLMFGKYVLIPMDESRAYCASMEEGIGGQEFIAVDDANGGVTLKMLGIVMRFKQK